MSAITNPVMSEAAAKNWLVSQRNVSRETMALLEKFAAFLRHEAESQNLISASSMNHIWSRHIVDSAQLLLHLPSGHRGNWLDLGSGAGFPGLVIAMLTNHPVTLVESRARRIDYLRRAVQMLDLDRQVDVAGLELERLKTAHYSVISARAFAPLPRLLKGAARFSTENTHWLLPKGKKAVKELDTVKNIWAVDFRVVPSITDTEAGILIGKLYGAVSRKLQQTVI